MPALGAAPVNSEIELAVGVKFADPKHRDLRDLGMACRFGGVWNDRPETAAIVQEIGDFELLVADDENIVIEPSLVDWRKTRIVEGFDIDTRDLDANLQTQAANFDHRLLLVP